MAQTVGMKLALEGEAQYKAGLQQIQQKSKELAAEMKAVVSAGEGEEKVMQVLGQQINNQKSLIDQLNTKYEKQKSDIEATKKAIEDAKKAYGDNSAEVQKLETQLTKQETALSKTKTQINNEKTALNNMEKAEEAAAKDADTLGDETKEAGEQAKKAGNGGFTVFKGVVANLATDALKAAVKGLKDLASNIKEAVTETASYGDEVDKQSQKLGLSAEKYQELAYAMEMSGADVEDFKKGMININDALSDFSSGNEDAAKAYTDLGVSMRNNDGTLKTSEEVLLDTVDALASMEDPIARDTAAQEIFGKKMTELRPLLNSGSEGIKQLMQEAKDYGMVMSDDAVTASANFDDSMTRLDGTVQGLKRSMAEEFLPSISDVADGFSKLIAGVEGGDEDISAGIQGMITTATEKVPEFLSVGAEIFGSILKGVTDNLPSIITTITGFIPNVFDSLAEVIGTIDIAELVKSVFSCMNSIITSIVPRLPELLIQLIAGVIEALPEMFVGIGETIYNIFDSLFGGYSQFDQFKEKVDRQTEAWQAVKDAMGQATDQINNDATTWSNSWDMLKNMTDSSGKVKEGFEGMAQVLIDQLNGALGLNIEIIDGQIQDYQTLCTEIDNLIEKKRAELILQAEEEAYAEALSQRPAMLEAVTAAEENLRAAQEEVTAAQRELEGVIQSGGDQSMAQRRLDNARASVVDMQNALDDAAKNLEENTAVQTKYMDDYTAVMEGDYNSIGRTSKKYTGSTYKDLVSYRKNVEKQLDQDQQNHDSWVAEYKKSNSEHAKAQVDYYAKRISEDKSQISKINGIIKQGGKDFTQGYINGILEKESEVTNAGTRVTNDALNAVQNTQQSQSPAKRTKLMGNDFGEGYKLGIDEKGNAVKSTAEGVAGKALTGIDSKKDDAKTAGETVGGNFITGIDSKQQAAYDSGDTVAQKAKTGLETQYDNASTAGKSMGGNFVSGLGTNDQAAYDSGNTLGGKFTSGVDANRQAAYDSGDWLSWKAREGTKTEYSNTYDVGSTLGGKFTSGVDANRDAAYDSGDWLSWKAREGTKTEYSNTYDVGSTLGDKFTSGIDAKQDAAYDSGDWLAYKARKGVENEEEAQKIYDAGGYFAEGFAAGIGDKGYKVVDAARATATAARNAMEYTLDEASPSKVTKKIGQFFTEGFAIGIADKEDSAVKSAASMAKETLSSLNGADFTLNDVSYQHAAAAIGGRVASNTTNNNTNTVTMNIYGAEGQDVNALAQIIDDRLQMTFNRRNAVYA